MNKPLTLNITILDYMITLYQEGYYTLNDKKYLKHLDVIKLQLDKIKTINQALQLLKQIIGPYTIITSPLYNDLFHFIYQKLYHKSANVTNIKELILNVNGAI